MVEGGRGRGGVGLDAPGWSAREGPAGGRGLGRGAAGSAREGVGYVVGRGVEEVRGAEAVGWAEWRRSVWWGRWAGGVVRGARGGLGVGRGGGWVRWEQAEWGSGGWVGGGAGPRGLVGVGKGGRRERGGGEGGVQGFCRGWA